MSLIQSSRQGSGGGGGLTIAGFAVDTHTQTTNFVSGGVVIALTQTPVAVEAIQVDYNGQVLLYNVSWSYSAGNVTILFDDPNVTDYDTPPIFQIAYSY